ncbi:ABC transporter permease subunit [Amycolatopsis granulosa]|uniref:branched-chain amino acid ABC transporter ATP-binding protein/permease n=1 Tax=Amycolatopsis granulosa TaxID=185684 RepID=UPI00142297EC|nr:branched-chain amino acid ABC transporter ATP-binding protein/permease [Amycolatopsis granulosa]NIH85740.1 ABC-type branched-subunit amino acid transport system permease subunit/ABC-type branched-subunit amino acid transport system ATPase component [Amycolatopsis granulosa]
MSDATLTARRPRAVGGPRTRAAGIVLVTAAVATLPLVAGDPYVVYLATLVGIYALVAMGLNLLFGYAGQVSLGHGALVAVGAYVAAVLTTTYGWSFWAALPAAMVAAGLVGSVMALPALRLTAWYLALITLAFGMVVNGLLVEMREITGGFSGILGVPRPEVGGLPLDDPGFFWLVLAFVVVTYVVLRNLVRSRIGRALISVRDAEEAARSSGADIVRLKVFAFFLSAVLAGAAGALLAGFKGMVTPDDFTIDFSVFFLLVVIVGGAGRLGGPVVGVLAFFVLPELLGALAEWRLLVYGAVLLVVAVYAPHGIAGAWSRWWRSRRPPAPPPGEPPPEPTGAAPREALSLSARGLAKGFGGVRALRSADLEVPAGTIHAVVGPNGSGKTTLLNTITGYVRADGGTVQLGGRGTGRRSPHRMARAGVGRTFQTPRLLPELSALDNVLLGAYARERSPAVVVATGLPWARREAAALAAEAMAYLRFVGLGDVAGQQAGALPHGKQRLLEIGRALMARPSLLLLDEPAAGLSMTELDALGRLLREIRAEGVTVVLIEHHIELVAEVSDAVTVLHEGATLLSAPPAAALSDDRVLDVYLGR